jgi:FkbM family methyltransferase
MLSIFNYFKHPEYVFRPRQVLRRFGRLGKTPRPFEDVTLPWGATVRVRPNENVGSDIFYYGIFDRIVPETIYRLVEKGELAVEIGANIGQNCSMMAYKTGSDGRVIAFEPHPEIFEELRTNAGLWPKRMSQHIQLENFALSETTGEAWLTDGSDFHRNRGTASLCEPATMAGRKFKVNIRTLDEYLAKSEKAGVCKIDVEGHELAVLKGAERSLSRKAIRDIIFEDFEPMFSPTAEFLRNHDYVLYQLTATWWQPILTKVLPGVTPPEGFSYNYLATLDPDRAEKRFQAGGWRCLTCSPLSG